MSNDVQQLVRLLQQKLNPPISLNDVEAVVALAQSDQVFEQLSVRHKIAALLHITESTEDPSAASAAKLEALTGTPEFAAIVQELRTSISQAAACAQAQVSTLRNCHIIASTSSEDCSNCCCA
jgi:ABC-type lipopolysaccharide export system ATPase subunit